MKKILLFGLLTACGLPEFSPWESKPKYANLTAKNLSDLRPSGNKLKVALIADPQAIVGHVRTARTRINARGDIDLVLFLGDLTDRGLVREFDILGDLIIDFNMPVLTVVGNHDGLNKGDAIYKKMFGPIEYDFMFRGFRFMTWNNNPYEWDGTGGRLRDIDQALIDGDQVIVFAHQPPHSGTINEPTEWLWEELRGHENYRASLHGHVHRFNYDYDGTHIYVADRVDNGAYGVMEHDGRQFRFFNCVKKCLEVTE